MWRTIVVGIAYSVIGNLVFAQEQKKIYSVKEECAYDELHFSLIATSGQCKISSSNHSNSLDIYGHPSKQKTSPNFKESMTSGIKYVSLNLENKESGVFDIIAGNQENDQWTVDLNANKKIRLDLDYGFGSSNINLSDTKVEGLNINTGSAEVFIWYDKQKENLCEMDTFKVKVEMGSLITQNICHSKAKTYIADIGFGSAVLDLSHSTDESINVMASVGAGSLEIHTPQIETPTIVFIKHSPLCHIKLPRGFKEIKKHTFVNDAYTVDAPNLRSFEIDVALGNITFLPPIAY